MNPERVNQNNAGKVIIGFLLIVVSTLIMGTILQEYSGSGEKNRIKAETMLVKARTELEKVNNQLSTELIDLIGTSLMLGFILSCGTIGLLAYFIHRVIQNDEHKTRVLFQITRHQIRDDVYSRRTEQIEDKMADYYMEYHNRYR
jgi:vacuolar-type H+-ATPase subunit I/STV1